MYKFSDIVKSAEPIRTLRLIRFYTDKYFKNSNGIVHYFQTTPKFEMEILLAGLTLYLIEMPFTNFANIVDPDQEAFIKATWSRSTLLMEIYLDMILR